MKAEVPRSVTNANRARAETPVLVFVMLSSVAELALFVINPLLKVPVVPATVLGVVAPTVPLMLIDAVPVRFVTVPELGVPNAPPLTTGAPALPTLTAKAVATPVPRPETPVLIGRPVQLVRVPL